MPNKNKALKWSVIDGIFSQGLLFIFGILVARILTPNEFGLVGMISIVSLIATALIDGGMSSALIRKGNLDQKDLSSVFFFNVLVAIIFFFLVQLTSGYFSKVFNEPILSELLSVSSISILLVSLEMVQRVILTTKLDFRSQAIITCISISISGSVGLSMALQGYGVWSLIGQQLSLSIVRVVTTIYYVRWYPSFTFDSQSFISLYKFGYKLLLGNLLDVGFKYLSTFIIGKNFGATSLGYYTQANKLSQTPAMTMAMIVRRVNYPLISKLKLDGKDYKSEYLGTLQMISMIMIPMFFCGSLVSSELIDIILGSKWYPAGVLLSYLMIGFAVYPVNCVITNILQLTGRSDLYLKAKIYNKVIVLIAIISCMSFGVTGICIAIMCSFYIELFINTYFVTKSTVIAYNEMYLSTLPSLFVSSVTFLAITYLYVDADNVYISLLVNMVLYFTLYISCTYLIIFLTKSKIILYDKFRS